MKVLTFSRFFPKGHPKEGQKTYFVEAVCNAFRNEEYALPIDFLKCGAHDLFPVKEDYFEAMSYQSTRKFHTIRAGNRFKVGDMVSLRVWSDKPYRSKQIEFAQVEVKKAWAFDISYGNFSIDTIGIGSFAPGCSQEFAELAANDGLSEVDMYSWFNNHPKKKNLEFHGQIISWSDKIDYGKPAGLEKEEVV